MANRKYQIAHLWMPALALFSILFFIFDIASAHEVYVLEDETIAESIAAASPNPLFAYFGNEQQFFFWGFVSFVVVSTILAASAFRMFETRVGPFFMHLKRYAHVLVRLTAGLSLIVFGVQRILYGPELPLSALFPGFEGPVAAMCFLLGIAFLVGAFTRLAAIGAILMFVAAVLAGGWYPLTYIIHLGAYVLLLILGGGEWSLASLTRFARSPAYARFAAHLRPFAFPIFRICFGTSLILAALYAKYFHSQLALEVVYRYELTQFFPFDPLFIVLGALIIEVLCGCMVALGVEIRWTGAFLLFWVTLGQISMDEGWWVHIILIGGGLALFFHGYDRYSLEGRYLKRHGTEPVL